MKKITINIKQKTLFFEYKNETDKVAKKLLNTNVISNDELIFSQDYLENNHKLVASFIKELALEREITNIVVADNKMATYIIDVIAKVEKIASFTILEDSNLSYEICEKIIKNHNIRIICCYSIPTFMIELLDKANIMVESRAEVFFTSTFMEQNNLTQYSKLYYKSSLKIIVPISEYDLNDFEVFCKINKYLKTIHIEKCNIDDITKIVNILEKNKIRNITIYIHDDIDSQNTAETLRKLNRRWSTKYKIKLKLVYSTNYINANYGRQIALTTLKLCSIIIFIIVSTVIGYIIVNNHISKKNVTAINTKVSNVLESVVTDDEVDTRHSSILTALLNVNSDTVGWLTLNNTNIDYPVVQAGDNSYYLKHNYDRNKDYSGWVFMDYRNYTETLDKNTIIYGHNRYDSGVMFGTLGNVLEKEWYENKDNLKITFNTLYNDYTWQIFSIYRINVTSDYLRVVFSSDSEFLNFINQIKSRSMVNFDTKVTADDKILTLSTCLENNRRLVVHAVLIKK